MKEEKIEITVNQEDVQNIINCYEKDIELIEKLKEKNKIYKTTIKGQHRKIEELKNAKKTSKRIHKERNKRLKEENTKLWEQKLEYIDRIKKALEYIDRRDIEWASDEHDKLIEILKGEKE